MSVYATACTFKSEHVLLATALHALLNGRRLGARVTGAEPPGRHFHRAQQLGARDAGAELGASINGAELKVHFLNSFRQGSICEKLSKKGLKCKKFDAPP